MIASKRKLNCVMLIDDNDGDNYLLSMVIKNVSPEIVVIEKMMALDALKHLEWNLNSYLLPDLIFLDLNLGGMDGWEFLEKFSKIENPQRDIIIIILSSSENPKDKDKFAFYNSQSTVSEFMTKPLTEGNMRDIMGKYFTQWIE